MIKYLCSSFLGKDSAERFLGNWIEGYVEVYLENIKSAYSRSFLGDVGGCDHYMM